MNPSLSDSEANPQQPPAAAPPPPPPPAPDSHLLVGLTDPQRDAVTHVDGPLLVIAGPGSGKTRVITSRIAYLLQQRAAMPWEILAVTFTNKAAREMKERVERLIEGMVDEEGRALVSPRAARRLSVMTFHGFCARTLQQYGSEIGLAPGFSIYDTTDQKRAVKLALEQLEMSSKNFPPGKVLHAISDAKNKLIDPEAFAQNAGDFYSKSIARLYRKYDELLRKNNAVDFDDLLGKTVELLRVSGPIRAQLQDRYRYVLVDEYQDTNQPQFLIASILAQSHKNICVTGDPDQSIYAWRGADIRNILEFESHYPDAAVVRLEQNYRSTKQVLAAADTLIQRNTRRKHKALWTDNEGGEPIVVVRAQDERHEANYVVERFEKLRDEHDITWGQMAVFYRANALSRVMEEALRDRHIPYQIARGTSFYERKEVRDAVAFLRVIGNPADEVGMLRIINTPARGISANSVKAMQGHALAQGMTLREVMDHPAGVTALNPRAVKAVERFAKLVKAWRIEAGTDKGLHANTPETTGVPPGESGNETESINEPTLHEDHDTLRGFVERVIRESGLEDHYRKDRAEEEGEDRLMNLGELVTAAQQFESDMLEAAGGEDVPLRDRLLAYLDQISLVSDVDAIESTQGAVTLMTLHAAKGLEFPAVAMIGVEDGLLPHSNSSGSPEEIEEERRLCFVGITRAMRFLTISHARFRTVYGELTPTIPSRFIAELDGEHAEHEDLVGDADRRPGGFLSGGGAGSDPGDSPLVRGQRREAQRRVSEFPPGTLVRHGTFGLGRIVKVTAIGAQTRAQVRFEVGVKTLVLEYAKLERID